MASTLRCHVARLCGVVVTAHHIRAEQREHIPERDLAHPCIAFALRMDLHFMLGEFHKVRVRSSAPRCSCV